MTKYAKSLILVAMLLPMVSIGASPAREEYLEVLAAKPDDARGREIFANCSGCHGPAAEGATDGSVPRIAGQHFQVLVRQIIDFRYARRWDRHMEDVAANLGILADAQAIADVASFVSHLDRGGTRGVGDGTRVERGAALFESRCASCHGPKGEGDGPAWVPRIGGQHADYLLRQFYDAVDGRRPPMARAHRKRFERLDFDDVLALSDYLSRVGWELPTPPPHPYETPEK
jgi:cytochrome c553